MLRSVVALARSLPKNSFASKAWTAATIQTPECRYGTDRKRELSTIDSTEYINNEKKRKIVKAEVTYWHEMGARVPDPTKIPSDDWEHLFILDSMSARKRYCGYLFVKDAAKRKQREDKATKRTESMEHRAKVIGEKEHNTHIYYGLGGNALLMRIRPATINKWKHKKLLRARLFGPKLVFDCSFDATMSDIEIKSVGRQLHYCFAFNRRHKMPFDMHLCNMNMSGGTLHWLQKHIPTVLDATFPLSIHEKCFTELFPRERLVYLSPDSDNVLTEYNADDIFVVGTIVDKGTCQKLSLAKAKSLGVRHARLPLDTHVRLACGAGKEFTLNAMTSILLEWKETQDWKKAFGVPMIEQKFAERIE